MDPYPPHLWNPPYSPASPADTLYSPQTESPITPTDSYDPPIRHYPPPDSWAFDLPPPKLAHHAYSLPSIPPEPASASSASTFNHLPLPVPATYPDPSTPDMAAFNEHGSHIPLRKHTLYPHRHHPLFAYRRLAPPPLRSPLLQPPSPPAPVAPPPPPEHQLTETHTIPAATLDSFFNTISVTGPTGRRAWVCQQCKKAVRKQDRAAHMLSHQGKKRYDCSCGKRFGRPQDADRHIREQAPCQTCDGKMGRYGKDGRCSTCVLESEHSSHSRSQS